MRSLVLVGHGSHRSGESAQVTYRHAEELRARGVFAEVLEGFWKEEPSLRQVLRTAGSTDVTVVPMFISEGYFTETVLPRELGLGHQGPVPVGGVARTLGGRTVRYTRPYGVHPAMTDVILARAREVCPDLTDPAAELAAQPTTVPSAEPTAQPSAEPTALILLGHGSTRNDGSRRVLRDHAERLRAGGLFAEVGALYLEDWPRGQEWASAVQAPRVVIVPFFGTEGGPGAARQLGLSPGVTSLSGGPAGSRTVHFARPVGTHRLVADVILELAREAGESGHREGDRERAHAAAWEAVLRACGQSAAPELPGPRVGPQVGARVPDEVPDPRDLRIGEVLVRAASGMAELRHALDEGLPGAELHTLVTAEGLRDVSRRDQAGAHRPVRTWRTLPRGWRAVLPWHELPGALHAVYPAVVEETHAHATHALRPTPWPTTARRQTGLYARVQRATQAEVEQVTARVCAACLRTPLWAGQRLNHTFLSGVPGGLPCAEACSLVVAEVRETLVPPRATPAPDPDPNLLSPDGPASPAPLPGAPGRPPEGAA